MTANPENTLLRTLAVGGFPPFAELERVDLAKGEELALPDSRIKHVWFPLSGIVSVVATTAGGIQSEVAIVGREGMVSVATLHGVEIETMHVFCQVPGQALRMPAAALRLLLEQDHELHNVLLGYAHNFMLQIASSALAYATQTIEARLARWLLMSGDRLDGPHVPMTHEAFALMLGVRRAGVTMAIKGLADKSAVTARRGVVKVLDRTILGKIAGDTYGLAEQAYDRIAGDKGRRTRPANGATA